MNVLITGGAGFIGRAAVKRFLAEGHEVSVFDNLSNGSRSNLEEFSEDPHYNGLMEGDISDKMNVQKIFEKDFDLCLHLAAQINVQESLDDPDLDFRINVIGTYNVLRQTLKKKIKTVVMGTCMVYDVADINRAINEEHPVLPRSPYAASKLTAENLAMSYYLGLDMPVVILRPFNVYGPYQKSNMEGGVVSVFLDRCIKGLDLEVYGDGTQTRDLLFVDDCAEFIYSASMNDSAVGEIINAGTGNDIQINDLARMIVKDDERIKHVEHIHPQSEIKKLLCDYSKAKRILGWEPRFKLEDGINITSEWLEGHQNIY